MAPNLETLVAPYRENDDSPSKPPSSATETLHKTVSDISSELMSKEAAPVNGKLPVISQVEDAKCECCGLCEECTAEYISRERTKFSGKLICGLCAAAVKEEMGKNGGKIQEALNEHMEECARFIRVERTYPVLYQAEVMRKMLRKSSSGEGRGARSASCFPAISKGDR